MGQRLLQLVVPVVFGAAAMLTITPTAAADIADDYFLNELYKTGQKWYWPYGEQYIIGVGHSVCDAWSAGVSYPDEVENMAASKRWTHRNARILVGLATGAYCPDQYLTVIPPQARIGASPAG